MKRSIIQLGSNTPNTLFFHLGLPETSYMMLHVSPCKYFTCIVDGMHNTLAGHISECARRAPIQSFRVHRTPLLGILDRLSFTLFGTLVWSVPWSNFGIIILETTLFRLLLYLGLQRLVTWCYMPDQSMRYFICIVHWCQSADQTSSQVWGQSQFELSEFIDPRTWVPRLSCSAI